MTSLPVSSDTAFQFEGRNVRLVEQDARKQAGHANIATTQRYSRVSLKSNSKDAVLRAGIGAKNEA